MVDSKRDTIKIISAEGCANCEKVSEDLKRVVGQEFNSVEVKEVDMASEEGQKLVAKHNILSSPGIVVGNNLVASGKIEKSDLVKKIRNLIKDE